MVHNKLITIVARLVVEAEHILFGKQNANNVHVMYFCLAAKTV